MKAWKAEDTESYESGCTVVFAETRGKARSLALQTDCCEDAEWCNVRVTRIPAMDKMWKPGKTEMDWYDPEDRIALVGECGWFCSHEYLDREEDCPVCPAKDVCDDYQDWKADEEGRYDQCYECRGLGDDYMTDEFGEQISMCETCTMNPHRQEENE